MAVTYQKPKDDDVPWDQRLVNYGQNTNSGLDEYKRAMGVYRSKSALGDTDGASAAQKWAGQVDTAIGGIGSRPGADTRNALTAWKESSQKPVTPWTFDPNNNQAYQSALQAAQRSAQTAGNNATVRLGARGIGNSQQALTTENQIQQRSVADVNSNILPQLMSQDYTRYRDGVQDQQKQNDNMFNYATAIGNLDQQDFSNNRLIEGDARQKQQDHINLANDLTKTFGVQVDPKDNPYYAYQQVKGLKPLAMREYEDGRADTKFEQDYKTNSFDHSKYVDGRQLDISQQQADANTARSNWDMSDDNADNQYKKAEVAKLKAEAAAIGKDKPLTTEAAINLLNKSSFVTEGGATDGDGVFHKNGTTNIDKKGLIQAIAALPLNGDDKQIDKQMDALFNYYGISEKDIKLVDDELRAARQSGNR